MIRPTLTIVPFRLFLRAERGAREKLRWKVFLPLLPVERSSSSSSSKAPRFPHLMPAPVTTIIRLDVLRQSSSLSSVPKSGRTRRGLKSPVGAGGNIREGSCGQESEIASFFRFPPGMLDPSPCDRLYNARGIEGKGATPTSQEFTKSVTERRISFCLQSSIEWTVVYIPERAAVLSDDEQAPPRTGRNPAAVAVQAPRTEYPRRNRVYQSASPRASRPRRDCHIPPFSCKGLAQNT